MRVPLDFQELSQSDMKRRAEEFYASVRRRRTVREFSDREIPREIIEDCLRAAGTAPSGANQQPWHFAIVQDAEMKSKIRVAAEQEENQFYDHLAPAQWLSALEPLGTDAHKPYLETAPYLIAVFVQRYGYDAEGKVAKHYYPMESVGIATGLLINALHHAGLVSLTHTPSPMGFLNQILARPENERPFLLLVVGYPADRVEVPDITRKQLSEIATFF